MQVGFIGLGIMGGYMAANLQDAGYDLIVYNRTADKAQPLLDAGATWAESPAALAPHVDLFFTMLAHPEAIEETALGEDGFLPHLRAGSLWVDCSTINPSFARRMAAEAAERDVRYIDAPVLGSRAAAENAQLTFLAGGAAEDLERCRPEMESMGKRIIHAGDVGMGTAMKVVFNHQLATSLAAFAEGLVLGQSLGITKESLFEMLLGSAVVAPIAAAKQPKFEAEEYDVDFPLQLMQKDLHMAAVAAYESGAALPLGNAAKEIYRLAMRSGWGDSDYAAIYQFLLEEWDVE